MFQSSRQPRINKTLVVNKMSKNMTPSLYEHVERQIMNEAITKGQYQLKPEEELALSYGVSRTTIREALNALERKKLLIKRKGQGNFLLKSVIDTKPRIDLHLDFATVLADMGMTPVDVATAHGCVQPSQMFQQVCPAYAAESEVQLITWTFFGNDKPAVHCYFEIPQSICVVEPTSTVTVGTKDIHAINTYFDLARQDITHYINTLCASTNTEVSDLFGLPEETPLVNFQQACYNIQDVAFAYTDIYFNPSVVSLKYVLQYESFYRKGQGKPALPKRKGK